VRKLHGNKYSTSNLNLPRTGQTRNGRINTQPGCQTDLSLSCIFAFPVWPFLEVAQMQSSIVLPITDSHRMQCKISVLARYNPFARAPPHRYFYVGLQTAEARCARAWYEYSAAFPLPPSLARGYVPQLCVCASCHMHRCQPHHWRVSSERGSSPASYMNEHTPSQHNCLATRHPSALSVIAAQWYQAFVVVRDLKCLYAMPVGSQVCCCLWL
jgi:hypothetical protein